MADTQVDDGHELERASMLSAIEWETTLCAADTGVPAIAERVMAALRKVPRHRFVPERFLPVAYANGPLPIGDGQTISQPFIVALMTHLLMPEPHHRLLEVGTGSGYQAAILGQLAKQVYSTEIVPALARHARTSLQELHYDNIEIIETDGGNGYPKQAPYDGIIVTAAAPSVPEPLLTQLKMNGRLVIPLGPAYGPQQLMCGTLDADRNVDLRPVLPVAFVPLTGTYGA